jgi:hypothetical protein
MASPALNSMDEREVLVAPDNLGTLEDDQLMMEIELVTELMIAGSGSTGALDLATIDAILGVRRPGGRPDTRGLPVLAKLRRIGAHPWTRA